MTHVACPLPHKIRSFQVAEPLCGANLEADDSIVEVSGAFDRALLKIDCAMCLAILRNQWDERN